MHCRSNCQCWCGAEPVVMTACLLKRERFLGCTRPSSVRNSSESASGTQRLVQALRTTEDSAHYGLASNLLGCFELLVYSPSNAGQALRLALMRMFNWGVEILPPVKRSAELSPCRL